MLQKIIKLLDKIEHTPLFKILSNLELNNLLKLAGIQLSSGIGKLKVSSINASELRTLLTALENRDIIYLSNSKIVQDLYVLVTFDDLRLLTGKMDVLPELQGLVHEYMPLDTLLESIEIMVPRQQEFVKIGEYYEENYN